MNFRDLHHAVEDVQAALNAGEIEIGTAEAVKNVLEEVDLMLVREGRLTAAIDELRQQLWDEVQKSTALKNELDARPRTSDALERLKAEYADLKQTTDEKIANQANSIKTLVQFKEFREAQLSAIAVALKARP